MKPKTALADKLQAAGYDTDGTLLRMVCMDAIQKHKGNALKALPTFLAAVKGDPDHFKASVRLIMQEAALMDEHWRRIFGHFYQSWRRDAENQTITVIHSSSVPAAPPSPTAEDQTATENQGSFVPAAADGESQLRIETHTQIASPSAARSSSSVKPSPARKRAVANTQAEITRSIFESFKVRDQHGELRSIGDFKRGELRSLESMSAFEYFLMLACREYVDRFYPNASMSKPIRDLIPNGEMTRLIADARAKTNGDQHAG